MKDFKEMDRLIFEFGKDMKYFADNYAGTMPGGIKTQIQDYMYVGFSKEIDAITEREALEIKYQKKFYDKLLKAKRKLANLERADAWFDKVFQKYFNYGVLEHLIVYAIMFLNKKFLFVAKRLFEQIGNDDLLAEFTAAACEYLGWTSQNAPAEEPTPDETESEDKQQQPEEMPLEDEATPQAETPTDVAVYESKPVQPIEQQPQPVVMLQRTVTHEVVTATPGGTTPATGADDITTISDDDGPTVSPKSDEKVPPSFYRPGGKSGKNS